MSFCGKIFSKSLVLRAILQELHPIGLQRWHHLHMLHLVLIFKVCYNKKNKKYHIIGTVPKCNRKIVETGKFNTPNTHIYDRSISWLCKGTPIKFGGVKLVLS